MQVRIDYTIYVQCVYMLQQNLEYYSSQFHPIGDEVYWPPIFGIDGRVVVPNPITKRKKGQPGGRRKNEMDWSKQRRRQVYSRCKSSGYNVKTCKVPTHSVKESSTHF